MSEMSPNKPYMIRACYEWIVDNNCTPYLIAWVDHPSIDVPFEHSEDGQITLNLSPTATPDLKIENEFISFSARFSGVSRQLFIPMDAVYGILARENGQGMAFDKPDYSDSVASDKEGAETSGMESGVEKPARRPGLKVVK